MENVGLKWYKCDFHLHTMNSRCYKNKEIDTVNEWIEEVKNKGLKCIAVTDHNDYRKIDEIKKLGEENKIVVFPGVELSCDTSKIHILVLFDIDLKNKVSCTLERRTLWIILNTKPHSRQVAENILRLYSGTVLSEIPLS